MTTIVKQEMVQNLTTDLAGKLSLAGGTLEPGADITLQTVSGNNPNIYFNRSVDGTRAGQISHIFAGNDLAILAHTAAGAATNTINISGDNPGVMTLNGSQFVTAGNIPTYLNASGSAPIYACRAWVNFNGTGTVAIRGSGNVSSITDNGVGNYTVNFTTAIQDANYSTVFSFDTDVDAVNNFSTAATPRTGHTQQSLNSTSACRVFTGAAAAGGSVPLDFRAINVSIFR